MSLFEEYIGKVAERYGEEIAFHLRLSDTAIKKADAHDEQSFPVRIEKITALVDLINRAGGVPHHVLSVEKISPTSVRVILSSVNGLVWRNYVFEEDFMFNFAQALSDLPIR